jgi:hypothetical protein
MLSSGTWSRVNLARADVSEERIISIFGVEKIHEREKCINGRLEDILQFEVEGFLEHSVQIFIYPHLINKLCIRLYGLYDSFGAEVAQPV